MATCITHKKMYVTRESAEDALIEARIQFEYAPGSGPVAVYQCDDCGHYHLSSKGPMNEKLSQYITDGKIKLHKEANRWMGQIKKR